MAKQVQKSSFLAKYGEKARKGHEQAKGEETKIGNMELPAGIENGIAQLVDCRIDKVKEGKQNAGEYFFYAAGIVKKPLEQDGVPVAGLRTQIIEMLCDTKDKTRKTTEEHFSWMYNELRKLGVDTSEMDIGDLEGTLKILCDPEQGQPHFRFRTWKGTKATEGQYKDKEPRVNHQWNGIIEYNEDDDAGGGIAEASSSGGEDPNANADTVDQGATSDGATEEPDAEDLDALAALADDEANPDEEAAKTLTAKAKEAGLTVKQIKQSDNWVQLVEMIREKTGTATPEPVVDASTNGEIWTPKVEDVYKYNPLDPRTKKPAAKGVDCEVISVDEAKKTVHLKNMANAKLEYKTVGWDALESPEE